MSIDCSSTLCIVECEVTLSGVGRGGAGRGGGVLCCLGGSAGACSTANGSCGAHASGTSARGNYSCSTQFRTRSNSHSHASSNCTQSTPNAADNTGSRLDFVQIGIKVNNKTKSLGICLRKRMTIEIAKESSHRIADYLVKSYFKHIFEC